MLKIYAIDKFPHPRKKYYVRKEQSCATRSFRKPTVYFQKVYHGDSTHGYMSYRLSDTRSGYVSIDPIDVFDPNKKKSNYKEDYNKICKENSEFKDSITKSFKENVIAIIFSSIDQTIHFAAVCYRSDPFSKVEKELYKEYPELKNKKFCFLFGGGTINRDGTLEENKIESNSNIIINYLD